MKNITRRAAICAMGGVAFSGALAGCRDPLEPICPADPGTTNPGAPLTIDVHSHMFNGADLQVENFFERVIALDKPTLKVLGPIMGALGRFSPTAGQEISALKSIENTLNKRDPAGAKTLTENLREERYQEMRQRLPAAYRAAGPRVRAEKAFDLHAQAAFTGLGERIENLPETYQGYKSWRNARLNKVGLDMTVDGALDFIHRNFQYRYVNVHDYLEEYSSGKARKIDLLIAHMVDYDFPVGDGDATRSSLAEQIAVMERICRLTNGRVHAYAPFCPFKQIAYGRGLTTENPMALIRDAILNRGFIGVKMYPPMGFRPLGNGKADLGPTFWDDSFLPRRLVGPDLGEQLDKALSDLYAWCQENGAPIMAHTAPTNVPLDKYRELLDPKYWEGVGAKYPGLRVDFGHFGHTDFVQNQGQAAYGLMQRMTPGPDSPGGRFYADSSFFAEVLTDQTSLEMQKRLAAYLAGTSCKGDAALGRRLMYGTDWEMVMIEGEKTTQYLARFEKLFEALEKEPSPCPTAGLGNGFFGGNAANYLGLKAGQPTRIRLDAFHKGAPNPPAWMKKVDALPVA